MSCLCHVRNVALQNNDSCCYLPSWEGDVSPRVLGRVFVSPSWTVLLWWCGLRSLEMPLVATFLWHNISPAEGMTDVLCVCLLSQVACQALKLAFGQSPELWNVLFLVIPDTAV